MRRRHVWTCVRDATFGRAYVTPCVDVRASMRRPEYHVTLWHCDDPVMGKDTVVRDALAACVGQPAHLQVSALVADEEVAAAQVVLLSGPDAVVAQGTQKAFRHITLAVASGVHAKMANLLPERLAKGKAMSYTLPEPFYLEGQVLGCTDG